MKRILLLSTVWLAFISAQAQPLLTLEEAVDLALQNSLGIQISKNELEIAVNNAEKGNAGYWPTVDLNAGGNLRLDNLNNQQFANGNEFNNTNVFSRGVNAGVALNWTIFDGKRMFATYDRLKELQAMGELQVRSTVERTVYDVSLAYFNIVRLQLQLKALELNMAVSAERAQLEKARAEVGKGTTLLAKQAQLDYNAMLTQQTQQQGMIAIAKVQLNRLLNRDAQEAFQVSDSIILKETPNLEAVKQAALSSNTELQVLKKSMVINEYILKEQEADKYPTIALNTNYGYAQNANSAGFQQFSNNIGLTGGFTLRWRLFDGGRVKRNIENTQMLIKNDQLAIRDAELQVHATLTEALLDYQQALKVAELETFNFELANESLFIVKERFRLGVASTLELKDAQTVFDQRANNKALALYQAKVAEINLMYLTGQLAVR